MSASISQMVRYGLHSATRKLAIEALAASLPMVILLTVPPSLTKPVASFPQSGGGQLGVKVGPAAGATNANIKEFTERVALSYVASLTPAAASSAAAVAEPSGRTTLKSSPSVSRAAVAPRASDPEVRVAPIAAKVLAAPHPTLETAEPEAAASLALARHPLPVRQAMILVADAWRSVPNTGAFVAENIVSVGNALSSLAKNL